MRVAVVGGGINGICCAWVLMQQGHSVSLFERDRLMHATSRASSKLLHGGLRYLENGQFRLVREALHERDGWLERAPHLARPLPMLFPQYENSRRPRWMLGLGIGLYGLLAGPSSLPKGRWLSVKEITVLAPALRVPGLEGGYLFYDAQMDDYGLGIWVAGQCRERGVTIHESAEVLRVTQGGTLHLKNGQIYVFDRIVNVAGPWAERLLERSGLRSDYTLDLVRGSHLVVNRACTHAFILEVPGERRIFFVLPWRSGTLIGTTEIRQALDEPVICTEEEKDYLITAYNHYFDPPLRETEIQESFAGLRPLLSSATDPSRASREYAIQRNRNLITVFGGKWTTALALAGKIAKAIY